MILRQIAYSFQHKAAQYCGVGKKGMQHYVPYEYLIASKMGDPIRKNEITALLCERGFDDECYIRSFLEALITSIPHPKTTFGGRTPDYDELVRIIQELPQGGEISATMKEDALKILEVVQVLCTRLGTTDLLDLTD
jgi:hypothetical protein